LKQLWFENHDDTAFRADGAGNTMAKRTAEQMDLYYRDLLRAEKLTSDWKVLRIPLGDTRKGWNIAREGQIDFSDAGFWLNKANAVISLGGSYEARCSPATGKTELRNTKGHFLWLDTIRSNPSRNDPWYFWLAETYNKIPEAIHGASFKVLITWEDNRTEIRETK